MTTKANTAIKARFINACFISRPHCCVEAKTGITDTGESLEDYAIPVHFAQPCAEIASQKRY